MISFAFKRDFDWLEFDILDPCVRFLLFSGFYFGKMWNILEKLPFFQTDTAGLGKYCMGGYGRIGVYRVKVSTPRMSPCNPIMFGMLLLSV